MRVLTVDELSELRDEVLGAHSDTVRKSALRQLEEAVLADSDHSAYRELADMLARQIGQLSGDADSWDGEDSELSILLEWIKVSSEWLPELYAHLAAEKIRREDPMGVTMYRSAADLIDPWKPNATSEGWGGLLRKSDGAEVPWQIINAVDRLKEQHGG